MDGDQDIRPGLEGVYFTESKICRVDGVNGHLYYRGYSVDDIAKYSSFEETCYLLLNGILPNKEELDTFSEALATERDLPDFILEIIGKLSGKEKQMHILSAALSALSGFDLETEDQSPEANMRKSIRLISKLSSIVAVIGARASGLDYIKPDKSLSHAENFLYMMTGKKPDTDKAKMLDRMLMLHAEHSSNASTFACLVSASTLSDIYLSVVAGVSALKGPLHGGADENALAMLHEIGNPDNTEEYIEQALSGKKKIMGFGHRVYKTYDPRAKIIKESLMEIMNGSNE
ncbi:2-methylcitrate synthase/citrate synthase II, partial [mine drainage metagenome]